MTDALDDTRDFFVSFNQTDRAWASWIAWVLEANGFSVIFQDWDFRGSFIEQMHRARLRARHTLVVLSDNYLQSEYARSEAWAALAGDPVGCEDRVVVVKVGPTSGHLGLLGHFGHLDLTGNAEIDAERLLVARARRAVEPEFRGKPSTRPDFPVQRARKAEERPRYPVPAHNLPPYNPDFVGREALLARLHALLTTGHAPAVLTQAITGLGGIGKTQTALAYAYRHLADYRLVWWLRAEERATLAADFTTLAAPLGLDPAVADQQKLIADVRAALQVRGGWLLVFDNVEDPELPRAILPTTGPGHALITSRRTDWLGVARALEIEVLEEREALQLLTGRPDPETLPAAERYAAAALARTLGYLPLALAQAHAYIVGTGKRFADYRRLFADRRTELLAKGQASPDYPESVATTWQISIEAAERECRAARPLLELLAFFAPDALPVAVLASDPAALPDGLGDELQRDDAIAALHRFSLLQAEAGTLRVHRLVQAVTRDRLDPYTALEIASTALGLAKAALPHLTQLHSNLPALAALVSHVLAISENTLPADDPALKRLRNSYAALRATIDAEIG
jgi:hypothetical protein